MPVPILQLLSEQDINAIHRQSNDLLWTTGVRVESSRARQIFASHKGIIIQDDMVRIAPEVIDQAISNAAKKITVYDRLGNFALEFGNFGKRKPAFGLGVTNLWYQLPEDDRVVPFQREHLRIATGLGHCLGQFDLVSTPGIPRELPPQNAELYGALEMYANTSKPLILLLSNSDLFGKALALLEHLHGDLGSHPFIIPYVNPVTPLVLNRDTTDKMLLCLERGLPLIFSNYGMSGSTTPISAAGTLVLLNAELLAGLVFTQLVKPGAAVIPGSLPAVFEMRSMTSIYNTQTMLLNLAGAEMAHSYGLPYCGTSGSGIGWGADLPAGGLLWMNHLISCLGAVDLAPFVGGNFDSLAFSPAMAVYANEIIREARLLAEGFSLPDDMQVLNEIQAVGPGGNFLETEQTLDHYLSAKADETFLWPAMSLEKWLEAGSPQAIDLLKKKTVDLISGLVPPEDHDEIIRKGEAWITNSAG